MDAVREFVSQSFCAAFASRLVLKLMEVVGFLSVLDVVGVFWQVQTEFDPIDAYFSSQLS